MYALFMYSLYSLFSDNHYFTNFSISKPKLIFWEISNNLFLHFFFGRPGSLPWFLQLKSLICCILSLKSLIRTVHPFFDWFQDFFSCFYRVFHRFHCFVHDLLQFFHGVLQFFHGCLQFFHGFLQFFHCFLFPVKPLNHKYYQEFGLSSTGVWSIM